MTWMDDIASQFGGQVGALPAGAFPAPLPSEIESAKADEAAARWAEKQRKEQGAALLAAQARSGLTAPPPMAPVAPPLQAAPDASSPAVQMALGNQPANVAPAPFSMAGPGQDGVPPSVKLAAAMSPPTPAPPPAAPPGAIQTPPGGPQAAAPPPAPPPVLPPGPDADGNGGPMHPATDVSARRRGAVAAPMSIAGPTAAPASAAPSGLDRLGDALLGFGGALQGDRGAMTEHIVGQRQALELQNQQRNATADLLAAKGATPAEIKAARLAGPDATKALLAEYLGKDKFSVVQSGEVEDQYGAKRKIFKIFNQSDGTMKDIPADTAAEAKATAQAAATDTSGLTGQAAMDKLKAGNPKYARQVQAIVDGHESWPTGRQANTPEGRKIIQDVLSVSGQAGESDFKNMQAVRKRYSSGKDFDLTKSINTVVDHAKDMNQSIDDLHNFSKLPGFLNPLTGKIAEQYDAKYQTALGRFRQNADTLARDYDFAVSGGRPSVSGRQAQRELYDEYGSPEKNHGALGKAMELLNDRLNEHRRGFEAGRLPHEPEGLVPGMNPEAADFIHSMATTGRASGNAAPASDAAPAAPSAPVIASKPDYDKLPKGSPYIAPDGSHRIKQ